MTGSLALLGAGPTSPAAGSAYQAAVLADSPALYWRLGEPSGTNMADASGNSRNGTYTANATLGIAGATTDGNTAISGAAAGSLGSIATYNPLAVGASRTIECFAWRNGADDNNYCPLWTSENITGGGDGDVLRVHFGGNDMRFIVAGTTATWANAWPGRNQWVHVALTFNETTDVAELFINKVSQGTQTQTGVPAGTGFDIGANVAQSFLNGKIDEVATYNQILTPTRIAAHYDAR